MANAERNGTNYGDLPPGFVWENGPNDWVTVGGTPTPTGSAAAEDPRGLIPYIRDTATKYGIDPDTAVKVARSEGLRNPVGDHGKSFGAFQLYTGGGLGNEFQKAGGDLSDERATIDYALAHAAQNGWSAFHGAKRVGIGAFDGINQQQTLALAQKQQAAPTVAQFTKNPAGAAGAARGAGDGPDDWVPVPSAPAAPGAGPNDLPDGFVWEQQPPAAPNTPASFADRWGGLPATTQANMPPRSTAADVATQLGSGVAEAIGNLPNSISDLGSAVGRGAVWAANKIAPDNETVKNIRGALDTLDKLALPPNKDPSSISSALPEPQTTAGEYARTVGNFVPAAAAGPGGVIRRTAQAVVPAVTSETGGQIARATGNPDLEAALRVAGAVAGGVGVNTMRTTPKTPVPTADELRDASRGNYKAVTDMGVTVKTEPMSALATKTLTDLEDRGLTPRTAPQTTDVVRDLQQTANPRNGNLSLSAQKLESARQELNAIRRDNFGNSEATAAGHVIDKLDDYLSNIPAADVHTGDARAASQLYSEARANWAAASRLDQVNAKGVLGGLNASTAGSGGNIDNATRQAVKQLVRPDKYGRTQMQKSGFTTDETNAANSVARGTVTGNVARTIGKLGPTGGLMGSLHGAAAFGTMGHSLPLTAITMIAKIIGDRSTQKGLERLSNTVAARSPLASSMGGPVTSSGLTTGQMALIASMLSARPAGTTQPR